MYLWVYFIVYPNYVLIINILMAEYESLLFRHCNIPPHSIGRCDAADAGRRFYPLLAPAQRSEPTLKQHSSGYAQQAFRLQWVGRDQGCSTG